MDFRNILHGIIVENKKCVIIKKFFFPHHRNVHVDLCIGIGHKDREKFDQTHDQGK
jgi:hypothetical protein